MKIPFAVAALHPVWALLLAGGVARAATPTLIVVYEGEGDAQITFGTALYGDPNRTTYQLGEPIEVGVHCESFHAGSSPPIAENTVFTVVDDAGSRVWSRSVGGNVGGGWSSAGGSGSGSGVTWDQTNTAGERVPPGTYWLGLELENPTYAVAEDTSRLQEVQILDGSWMFRHAFQSLGAESVSVAAGDLDGDGAVDLVFHHCESGSAHNEVYWNNGDGTFVSGYSFHEAPSIIPGGSLQLGDLDADGDLDLVEMSLLDSDANDPTTLRVYLNDGSGVFDQPTHIPYSNPSTGYWDASQLLALGDVNGDGALDAVASFTGLGQTLVFINDGSGNLIQSGVLPSTYPQTPALGDLDGDGDLDLVVGRNESVPNLVFFNDGSGNFTDSSQLLGDSYTYSVGLGDLDGDGDLDLIEGNIAGPGVVYWNDGAGALTRAYSFQQQEWSYAHPVITGDLDDDGDLDVVTAGSLTWVYENDGAGALAAWPAPLAGTSGVVGDAELVDVDGDGDLDLVTAGIVNYLYYNVMYSPNLGPKKDDANPSDDQPPYAADSEGSSGLSSAEAEHDPETGTGGNGVVESGSDCDSSDGRTADCRDESNPTDLATLDGRDYACSLGVHARHGRDPWLVGLLAAAWLASSRRPRGRVRAR